MKAYKEKQYLVFEFEDGKSVRYNLATGETIGKLGLPVKDICTQLSGYDLIRTIESFEDEKYSNFLKFIDLHFINKCTDQKRRYYPVRVSKIRNVGSFLARIKHYDKFEQYFACGLTEIDPKIKYKLNEIPKGLIKLAKEHGFKLEDQIVVNYIRNPDMFNLLLSMECNSITKANILGILRGNSQESRAFTTLLTDHNYHAKSLITYIDNLMTYEALEGFAKTLGELVDYCNMMLKISPKYEKYPKNFLTTHRIASRNYNRLKQIFDERDFGKRIDKTLEYAYEKYIIVYPDSTQDIKDEAVQQSHCVASYIDKVIRGECHILFLRDKDEPEKSLVTLEVRNNKVVQAQGRYCRDLHKDEKDMVEKYNKRLERLMQAC